MTRLLGTPIETARDDDRRWTYVLSDLHVGDDGGRPLQMLATVLADAAVRGAASRVLILGDLFDSYVGDKQLAVGAWSEVAELLAGAARQGVSLTALHGNRDFMLGEGFTLRTGCRVVPGGLALRLAGRRALLLHGDELLLDDHAYQRAKRWLRARRTRALLARLPLWVSLRLAARARARSRQVTYRTDPARFAPCREAVDVVSAQGYELLVFGHIHLGARGELPAGGAYCVLPAFEQDGVHLLVEGNELRYRSAWGDWVADYPPRDFPPARSGAALPASAASR